MEPVFQICDTRTVLNRSPFKELEEWINEPLADDIHCLEIEGPSWLRPSDGQVWQQIKGSTGVTNISMLQHLPDETKRAVLRQLKETDRQAGAC